MVLILVFENLLKSELKIREGDRGESVCRTGCNSYMNGWNQGHPNTLEIVKSIGKDIEFQPVIR